MTWQLTETVSGERHLLVENTRLHVSPRPGARYYLVDSKTGKTPTDVVLERKGDSLHVRGEKEGINIDLENFWQVCQEGKEQCFVLLDTAQAGVVGEQTIITQGAVAGTVLLAGEIISLDEGSSVALNMPSSSGGGQNDGHQNGVAMALAALAIGVGAVAGGSASNPNTNLASGTGNGTGNGTIPSTKPPAQPAKAQTYIDDTGEIKSSISHAHYTDEARPALNIGTIAPHTARLYVDGVAVDADYHSGSLKPIQPLSEGEHRLSYRLINHAKQESPLSEPLVLVVDKTAPTFTQIAQNQPVSGSLNQKIAFFEGKKAGDVLADLNAKDTLSGVQSFRWEKGNDATHQSWFVLDSQTGEITLSQVGAKSDINHHRAGVDNSVALKVKAVDMAGNISAPLQMVFEVRPILHVDAVQDYISDTQHISAKGKSVGSDENNAIHTTMQDDVLHIGENGGAIHNTNWHEEAFVFMLNGNDRVSIGHNLLNNSILEFGRVYLGKGDDVIEVQGDIYGTLTSTTNKGADAPAIFGEEGDDTIHVLGDVRSGNIFAGSGSDTVVIGGELKVYSIVDLGSGKALNNWDNLSYKYTDADAAKGLNSLNIFGSDNNIDTANDTNHLMVGGIRLGKVYGGAGNDHIVVGVDTNQDGQYDELKTLFSGSLIELGDGNNSVIAEGIRGNAQIIGGNGVDSVTIHSELGAGVGKSLIDLAGGDDVFIYQGSYQHDAGIGAGLRDVSIRGGEGEDTLTLTLNNAEKSYSAHSVTGMSTEQFTGFEKVSLSGTSILDVETTSYLNDSTRNGAMKITYSGVLDDIGKVGVDLGANQLNNAIQDHNIVGNVASWGGWQAGNQVTENNVSYTIYTYQNNGLNGEIWIQDGIAIF